VPAGSCGVDFGWRISWFWAFSAFRPLSLGRSYLGRACFSTGRVHALTWSTGVAFSRRRRSCSFRWCKIAVCLLCGCCGVSGYCHTLPEEFNKAVRRGAVRRGGGDEDYVYARRRTSLQSCERRLGDARPVSGRVKGLNVGGDVWRALHPVPEAERCHRRRPGAGGGFLRFCTWFQVGGVVTGRALEVARGVAVATTQKEGGGPREWAMPCICKKGVAFVSTRMLGRGVGVESAGRGWRPEWR